MQGASSQKKKSVYKFSQILRKKNLYETLLKTFSHHFSLKRVFWFQENSKFTNFRNVNENQSAYLDEAI